MAESWPENADTASDADALFTSEEVSTDDNSFGWFDGKVPDDPGDIVDAEILDEPAGRHSRKLTSDRPAPLDRGAKSGQPNIDEWQHFFSKVIIRLATDWYIEYAFRGIDEDMLSEREVERVKLADDERERIARPFAEYSNKSKFMRKHGRMIIASADSIDAALQLGMWFSRVNRIASKYRAPGTATNRRNKPTATRAAPVFRPQPRVYVQPEPVQDDSEQMPDVSAGPREQAQANGHPRRPDVLGPVYNPGSG